MKKAQNVGQIFIYVVTIVIVGVIFLFGYRSITQFSDRADQVESIQFQNRLEGAVKSIAPKYGDVKSYEFNLPSEVMQVCFVRNDGKGSLSANEFDGLSLLEDAYEGGKVAGVYKAETVFLLNNRKQIITKYDVGEVGFRSDEIVKCFPSQNNALRIRLEGLGDGVIVS